MLFLFDSEDIELVNLYKWRILKNGYVGCVKYVRGSGRKHQKNTCMYFHRLVLNAPDGKIVDHINRNKLDNRKENLRICNQMVNSYNSGMLRNNTSGIKGVAWHKSAKKWESFIHVDGRKNYLGLFTNIKDAIKTRDDAFNNAFERSLHV